MIVSPVLELAICAKLKLMVCSALHDLGALLNAKELEKGKMNISPKVIKVC
jgi:hypothetical protein